MLKRIFKQKRYFKNIYKSQKGITGLETAIILIAFVVVAAVFAYTVLSAGLFSTQKAQEAVYNGLAETQSTLEVKGAVLSQADPKDADNADDVATWADGAGGVVSQETTIVHQGTGSILVTSAAAVDADDVLASTAAATITASEHDTVTFWARYAVAGHGSDVGFAAAAAAVGLVDASVSKVAISGIDAEWHAYSMTIETVGANQSLFVGLYALDATFDSHLIYIDDVQVNNVSLWTSSAAWTPYSSNIILTLALATGGTAVDFTKGNELAVTNGCFSGTNKTNKMVVNYNDSVTHLADVVWTATWIGNSNGDAMLDPGEKVKLTISLAGVTGARVDANHQFTLEVKSPKGAILSLQRTMPSRLYGIDNLN